MTQPVPSGYTVVPWASLPNGFRLYTAASKYWSYSGGGGSQGNAGGGGTYVTTILTKNINLSYGTNAGINTTPYGTQGYVTCTFIGVVA